MDVTKKDYETTIVLACKSKRIETLTEECLALTAERDLLKRALEQKILAHNNENCTIKTKCQLKCCNYRGSYKCEELHIKQVREGK